MGALCMLLLNPKKSSAPLLKEHEHQGSFGALAPLEGSGPPLQTIGPVKHLWNSSLSDDSTLAPWHLGKPVCLKIGEAPKMGGLLLVSSQNLPSNTRLVPQRANRSALRAGRSRSAHPAWSPRVAAPAELDGWPKTGPGSCPNPWLLGPHLRATRKSMSQQRQYATRQCQERYCTCCDRMRMWKRAGPAFETVCKKKKPKEHFPVGKPYWKRGDMNRFNLVKTNKTRRCC